MNPSYFISLLSIRKSERRGVAFPLTGIKISKVMYKPKDSKKKIERIPEQENTLLKLSQQCNWIILMNLNIFLRDKTNKRVYRQLKKFLHKDFPLNFLKIF